VKLLSLRNVALTAASALSAFGLLLLVVGCCAGNDDNAQDLSRVIDDAKQGRIEHIEVNGNKLTITLKSGREYTSRKEDDASIVDILNNQGVAVGGAEGIAVTVKRSAPAGVVGVIVTFLPLLIFGAILAFFMWLAYRRRTPPFS
jgi:ATP-dependent Zn protease